MYKIFYSGTYILPTRKVLYRSCHRVKSKVKFYINYVDYNSKFVGSVASVG